MSGLSHEAIQKHVKIYIAVFVSLAFLTLVTVGVSYLHFPLLSAVAVALVIATVKGALVALFFMHLSMEKKIIYSVLIFTAVFFLALLIFPSISRF
jgi:cytochrome c oxidase subunit 4